MTGSARGLVYGLIASLVCWIVIAAVVLPLVFS